jgi:hypothetical protein
MMSVEISLTFGAFLGAATLGIGCSHGHDRDLEQICLEDCANTGNDGGEEHAYCTVQTGNGERTAHQCNGHFVVSMQFETIKGNCAKTLGKPDECRELHVFGVDIESYEVPAVMACCDAIGTPKDEVLTYCAMDLVEQICRSIPLRLEDLIKKGFVPNIVAKQAKHLLAWLEGNQQECYDALHQPSDTPGNLLSSTWVVNEGENKGWKALDEFTITLEKALVFSASLPEDEDDYLACEDSRINNEDIFDEAL